MRLTSLPPDRPADVRETAAVIEWEHADEGRAPICPACGVTALPAETANVSDPSFICDNADCDAFGTDVTT